MTFRTFIITATAFAFTAIAAFAHTGATGVVKERMEMMKDIASETKLIGLMVKGDENFDTGRAVAAANAIAEHAARIPDAFPEGDTSGPSEAAPEIWENWDAFVALTEELISKAETLAQAAENAGSADDIRPAFRELGKTCMSCHEDFREAG